MVFRYVRIYIHYAVITALVLASPVVSLNGGRAMVETSNGWKAIEVITEGDEVQDPSSSSLSSAWRIRDMMDGMGAYLVDGGTTLRILVNHERSGDDATISEININKDNLKRAIEKHIRGDNEDVTFVESARRAFDEWTGDGDRPREDMNWRSSSDFCRFCSSQSYEANTFGTDRGFVDRVYITGEECSNGRLFVLDAATRRMYQLSGVTGNWQNGSGRGGMPYDSFENAALVDTGDTNHIALLLSADGGTETLRLYIGKKGMDAEGNSVGSENFLARNGLLYGEWFYLGNLSGNSLTRSGKFVNDKSEALRAEKFEDIDTNPLDPKQVVLAESNSGVYILAFDIIIDNTQGFNKQQSKFTASQITDFDFRAYQYPDNVDWTRNNLIFVNRDTGDGGIFYMSPNGDGKTQVGRTVPDAESTGILDLSNLLNFPPSSVMVTTNQGSPSSMTLLLNPALEGVFGGQLEEDTSDTFSEPGPSTDPEKCPTTSGMQRFVIQGEDTDFRDAIVVTREADYCGTGYVDFGKGSDIAGVTFEVEVSELGKYLLSVRYSNGAPAPRPAVLSVNGNDDGNFAFASTGESWSVWSTESQMVDLVGGRNIVELWWRSGSKRPNLDWLSVDTVEDADKDQKSHTDCMIQSDAVYNEVFEAEDVGFVGADVVSREDGYCGVGYIDFEVANIAGLFLDVDLPRTGVYEIAARYANGSPSPRSGLLVVDGEVNGLEFAFKNTGDWSDWTVEVLEVAMDEGSHNLEIWWGDNEKRPNIDQLSVEFKTNARH